MKGNNVESVTLPGFPGHLAIFMGSKSVSAEGTYAIVAEGGHQHRVKEGQRCRFARVDGEPGQSVDLDKILLVAQGDKIELGAPYLSGRKVTAKIIKHGRGDKVTIFKMRRRKGYRRTQGHRQDFTEVEITGIK